MEKGKNAPEEQFLPLSAIFYYLMLDFYVKTGIRFSLRDKRLFEITKVEITRVDCTNFSLPVNYRRLTHVVGGQITEYRRRALIFVSARQHIVFIRDNLPVR